MFRAYSRLIPYLRGLLGLFGVEFGTKQAQKAHYLGILPMVCKVYTLR